VLTFKFVCGLADIDTAEFFQRALTVNCKNIWISIHCSGLLFSERVLNTWNNRTKHARKCWLQLSQRFQTLERKYGFFNVS